MDFKDRIEKIKITLPLKFFYEKSFDTNNRTKISSDLKLDGLDKSASILKCGVLLTRALKRLKVSYDPLD
jgi:3-deoxy-D-manno-octulosonic acid (KDO) 8-phosphate synthase